MSTSKTPSKEELLKTIKKLENNSNDLVGVLADVGIVAVGGGLGALGAGALATAAGATAIPVLTTVGSWVGVAIVGATPIGWVVGTAVAGGAAVYGVSRLIKGSGFSEGKKQELLNKLKERVKEVESKQVSSGLTEDDTKKFILFLKEPLEHELISPEDVYGLMDAVAKGQMPLKEAYQYVKDLLAEAKK